MAESKTKKSNNGLIIGIVIGVVVIVVAVIIWVIVASGSGIKNISELKSAISDRKAINCTMSDDNGNEFLLQSTDEFRKVRIVTSDGNNKSNVLYLEDDFTYYWEDDNSMAYKLKEDSAINEFVESVKNVVDEDEDEDNGVTLKCKAPSKAEFAVPSGVEFTDFSDFM